MDLKTGLRLAGNARAALVGAGGKTTALFHLAGAYGESVLLTATTHLAPAQLSLADRHFQVTDPTQLPAWQEGFEGDTLLFTGPDVEGEERVSGVDDQVLAAIHMLANRRGLPMLIEADGARRLPLKAPAAHEPPIPGFVDTVIILAGLSGVGQPLSGETVHRPRIFGELADLEMGDTIRFRHLRRVLVSPRGGLKNIPAHARRVVVLNQADVLSSRAKAQTLVDNLLAVYQAVGLASLEQGKVYAVHEPVAGVVLAAGGSRRYGESKQLLPWKGEPLVRHAAQTALEAGLDPVVLVSGAEREHIEKAVADLDLKTAFNPEWKKGQSTSVRAGLASLPPDVGGAVFLLADQPHIPEALVRSLRAAHAEEHAPIVSPRVEGRRANPVLFDRRLFPELRTLEGDVGGRVLFERYTPRFVPWTDEKITFDVDTPRDYQRLMDDVDRED